MTTLITHEATLPFQPPLTSGPMVRALTAHALPGLERPEPDRPAYTRLVSTETGPAIVTVDFTDPDRVGVTLRHGRRLDAELLLAAVSSWLDLDHDPLVVDRALAANPLLAPMIMKRPGLRILGSLDPFETAVGTVIGQQVSLAAGRTFGGRLINAYGGEELEGFRSFPAAGVLAALDPDDLRAAVGLTGARARTLHGLATAVADGLDLHRPSDPLAIRRELLSLFGIGPWTVDYLAVRAFGDRDACPVGDLVLKRALKVKTDKEAAALSESWRPWRAYGVTHLWTEDSFG